MSPTAEAVDPLEPLPQTLDQLRAAVATDTNFDPAKTRLTVAIAGTDCLHVDSTKPNGLAPCAGQAADL
jgi:hypothetical protein